MSRPHTATPQPTGQALEQIATAAAPLRESPTGSVGQVEHGSQSNTESAGATPASRPETGRTSVDLTDGGRFQPFQDLYKTAIRLEYGDGPDDYYTIHLEMLCCYSETMRQVFAAAKRKERAYKEALAINEELRAVTTSALASESFSAESGQTAMKIIFRCLLHYPLKEYQTWLADHLIAVAEKRLFSDPKKLQNGSASPAMKKQAEFRKWDPRTRLQVLNHYGTRLLAGELFNSVLEITEEVKKEAKKNVVMAAAQKRIITHDSDGQTVQAVVRWLYMKDLTYKDAEHLCNICKLANDLGIAELAQSCMAKLYTAAWSSLNNAYERGIPLCELLEGSNDVTIAEGDHPGLSNVVRTIFNYVFSAKGPPSVFVDFVIEAIAARRDERAFEKLCPRMTKETIVRITMAILKQPVTPVQTEHCEAESQGLIEEDVKNIQDTEFLTAEAYN